VADFAGFEQSCSLGGTAGKHGILAGNFSYPFPVADSILESEKHRRGGTQREYAGDGRSGRIGFDHYQNQLRIWRKHDWIKIRRKRIVSDGAVQFFNKQPVLPDRLHVFAVYAEKGNGSVRAGEPGAKQAAHCSSPEDQNVHIFLSLLSECFPRQPRKVAFAPMVIEWSRIRKRRRKRKIPHRW